MNTWNHLEYLKVLEYYHKDVATKIAEQYLQHIFHRKKRSMAKKSLDEQVQPKYNISEDGNQWEHLLMHLSVEHLLMHFSEEIIILDNYNN